MIPGGLVARVGLRVCPRSCAGQCIKATRRSDGTIVPSTECELMSGPPPKPGTIPPFWIYSVDQLEGMAKDDRDADPYIQQAAIDELAKRRRSR